MVHALGHLLQGQQALEGGKEGYFPLSSTFLNCQSASAQCYSPAVGFLVVPFLSEMYFLCDQNHE